MHSPWRVKNDKLLIFRSIPFPYHMRASSLQLQSFLKSLEIIFFLSVPCCFQIPSFHSWYLQPSWEHRYSLSLYPYPLAATPRVWHCGLRSWWIIPHISSHGWSRGVKFKWKQSQFFSTLRINDNTGTIWLLEKQKIWLPWYLKILEDICEMYYLSSKGRLKCINKGIHNHSNRV